MVDDKPFFLFRLSCASERERLCILKSQVESIEELVDAPPKSTEMPGTGHARVTTLSGKVHYVVFDTWDDLYEFMGRIGG